MTPQVQGEVLAVHTSQLSRENLALLAQQGYGILPDQTGWLVFVRVPPERDRAPAVRRLAPDTADAAEQPGGARAPTPHAARRAPDAAEHAHEREE